MAQGTSSDGSRFSTGTGRRFINNNDDGAVGSGIGLHTGHRVYRARPGDPLQLVHPSILEPEGGPGQQIACRPRDHHLGRPPAPGCARQCARPARAGCLGPPPPHRYGRRLGPQGRFPVQRGRSPRAETARRRHRTSPEPVAGGRYLTAAETVELHRTRSLCCASSSRQASSPIRSAMAWSPRYR